MTEHGAKPHTLDQHINEPMSGKGKNEPPAPVPPMSVGPESTEEADMGKVEKVAKKNTGKVGKKVASGPGKVPARTKRPKAPKPAPAPKAPAIPAIPATPAVPAAPAPDAGQSDPNAGT